MADQRYKRGGRLTPIGVSELHRLRVVEKKTYKEIEAVLGVCSATVYGTVKKKTNADLHPDVYPYEWAQVAA